MEDYTFIEGEIMVNEEIYSYDFIEDGVETQDEDDAVKCGDIFLVRSKTFALICGHCNAAYDDLYEFGEHIIGKHLDGRGNENSLKQEYASIIPTAELVEEVVSEFFETDYRPKAAPAANRQGEPKATESANRFRRPLSYDSALFCKQCNQQFPRKSLMDAHNEFKHNKPRPCEFCFETFENTSALNEHRQTHTGDRRRFHCPKCPKIFTTKYYRNAHFDAIHEGIKKFKCPYCPMSFCLSTGLSVHLPTHSLPGEYSCEICNRQFAYKSEVTTHMRVHTGEKPFQCEICGKRFGLQNRLTQHRKRHLNQRDFQCKECGKRFYSNASLKNHAIGHSSNHRPFECDVCGRNFARTECLKAHKLLHEPKKFACLICNRSFAQRPGLLSHMKWHRVKERE